MYFCKWERKAAGVAIKAIENRIIFLFFFIYFDNIFDLLYFYLFDFSEIESAKMVVVHSHDNTHCMTISTDRLEKARVAHSEMYLFM